MRPSRSACPWRILKISSCLRRPLNPWTPRSLATVFSSVMVLSFNSDRFILLPPAPPDSDEAASVASDFCDEGRLGLRCEMVFSGGLIVFGVRDEPAQQISHKPEGDVNTKARGGGPCASEPHSPCASEPHFPCASEPHFDDGLAANFHQPFLESDVVLLPVQDVADLVPGLGELLARQRLLGVELE